MAQNPFEDVMRAYEGIVGKDPSVGDRMSPSTFRNLYERTFSEKMSPLAVLDIAGRMTSWFSGWSKRFADPFRRLNDAVKAEAGSDALMYLGMSRDQEDAARWFRRYGVPDNLQDKNALSAARKLDGDQANLYAVNERLLCLAEKVAKKLPAENARRLRMSIGKVFAPDRCKVSPPFLNLHDNDVAALGRMAGNIGKYTGKRIADLLSTASGYDDIRSRLATVKELENSKDTIRTVSDMASEMRMEYVRRSGREADIPVSRTLGLDELSSIVERTSPHGNTSGMSIRDSVRMEVDREICDSTLDSALLERQLSPHDVETLVNAGVRNLTSEHLDDIYRHYGPKTRHTQREFLSALIARDRTLEMVRNMERVTPPGERPAKRAENLIFKDGAPLPFRNGKDELMTEQSVYEITALALNDVKEKGWSGFAKSFSQLYTAESARLTEKSQRHQVATQYLNMGGRTRA